MNARGISVFYGAVSAEVALAEVRPVVGSRVVTTRFLLSRPIRLLDLEALQSVTVAGSVFDPTYIEQLEKAHFLGNRSRRIASLPGQ
jgi:hypothetical protein